MPGEGGRSDIAGEITGPKSLGHNNLAFAQVRASIHSRVLQCPWIAPPPIRCTLRHCLARGNLREAVTHYFPLSINYRASGMTLLATLPHCLGQVTD
jgi:hypothetical protein